MGTDFCPVYYLYYLHILVRLLCYQDERLNDFTLCFYKYNAKLIVQDDPGVVENSLKKSIDGLQNAQDVPLVRHLYLILDRLFALSVKPTLSPKGGSCI